MLILYVDAGSTTPPGLPSLWEDELAASLVQKSYHLSRLGCDMICSRLNSWATQSASQTAECQRFGECVYVASCEQGHLATPSSQTPTVLYLVSLSQPLPSKDWWSGCMCHYKEAVIIKQICAGAAWWHGKAHWEMFSDWLKHWEKSVDVIIAYSLRYKHK